MTDELKAAIEVTKTKSNPPIEDAFDAEFVSVPRNAWLSALAVACLYRAEHPEHDYRFMSSHGEVAPGKSLDTYSYCHRCGSLRHDYDHGGGLADRNYPLFAAVGEPGWRSAEPPCQPIIR